MNEKSPNKKSWDRKAKSGYLKNFGCQPYLKNPKREKSKLDPPARKHVLLGYDSNSTADLLQGLQARNLTGAKNALFNEKGVVRFSIEKGEQDFFIDHLFDLAFDDEYESGDSQNVVTIDIQVEPLEIEVKPEVLQVMKLQQTGCLKSAGASRLNHKFKLNVKTGLRTQNTSLPAASFKHHLFLRRVPLDQVHRNLPKLWLCRNDFTRQVTFSKHPKILKRK